MTDHGTTTRYDQGCRCPSCVKAQQVRVQTVREARLATAIQALTPTAPAPEETPEEPENPGSEEPPDAP